MAEPKTAERRASLAVALSTPALRRCQLAAAVARIVDMATLVAVSVHLFAGAGAGAVATFVAIRTLAPGFGTPVITALAARRVPGRALTACAAVAAGASAVTALLVASDGSRTAIYVLAAVTGVALCCLRPLVTALLPCHITGPGELVATNATTALLDNASTLAGPVLAGVATATVGPAAALWVASALLVVTAVYVGTITDGQLLGPVPSTDNWVREMFDGARSLARPGPIRVVVLLSTGQTFVRGALNVLVVSLAIESLDMGEGGVGLLLGAIGVGGLVGFPVALRTARRGRMARALGFSLLLWGAPIAAVAHAPGPVVALLLFAVIGVGNDLVDITSDTLLQRLVPSGSLIRVLGAFDAVLFAGMGLGAVAAQGLLDGFGLEASLVVVGLVLPALALASWRSLVALDKEVGDRDTDVAILQIHGIFSPLVMSTVDHLVGRMDRETYAAGEVIIRKGEEGDRFLLIEEGDVEIVDDGELLAVLGPGDGFGEMALLDDAPRNATAIARSAVCVRTLRRTDFLHTVATDDEARRAALDLADRRRRTGPRP